MTELVPMGVSSAALSRALDRFTAALGPNAVLADKEQLAEFRDPTDPFMWQAWDEHWGAAVVMSTTVDEVREVVRIANEFQIPLWTSSQGQNNCLRQNHADAARVSTAESAARGQDPRSQRGVGLRRGRTRRPLHRPLPPPPQKRLPHVAAGAGYRLGKRGPHARAPA
jgi:hypothetical protein